jgi:translocation and assembly module TamB
VTDENKKSFIKKFFKVVGWIVGIILLLLISIILLIRLPGVQNQLTQKAVHFLEDKIGTKVELQNIFISFPKKIVLEGLYLEDQAQDTLLYIDQLSIDTDLWALTHQEIQLNEIDLSGTRVFVSRSDNSAFNFDYIINAFTDSTATKTESSNAWKFSLEDIDLTNVSILYVDNFSGDNVQARLGSLVVKMKEFDLEKMSFNAKSIEWKNSKVQFTQSKENIDIKESSNESDTSSFSFNVGTIDLGKISLAYANTLRQQKLDATIGEFSMEANAIDIPNTLIDLDKIELHDSFISYFEHGTDKNTPVQAVQDSTSKEFFLPDWNIKLAALSLSGNSFQYQDFSKPVLKNSFDPSHLWLRGLQVEAANMIMSQDGVEASIKKLTASDQHGFSITSLAGQLALTNTSVTEDLKVKTQHSEVVIKSNAKFKSLDQLLNEYEQIPFDANLSNSTIALKDVLYFTPTLLDSLPIMLPKQTKITIDANVHGTLRDLLVEQLTLSSLSNTSLALQGSVKGLPDVDKTIFDIQVKKLYTTSRDIKNIVADSLLPSSIQLPEWIQLAGDFKGTIKQPKAHAELTSDVGNVEVNYRTITSTPEPSYEASITTHQLELGKILKQAEIGKLDVAASIKGSGFTMEELDAALDVDVKSFVYSDYNYKNFKLTGTINKYLFTGHAALNDKNLDFDLKGSMDYQQEIPHYAFTFELKNADFNQLHLSDRPLKVKATLDLDLATSDFKIVNGSMGIRDVGIYNGKALYRVDSLLFAALDQEGKSELSIRSEILTGDFKGTFNVFEISTVLKQHINHYFSLNDKEITDFKKPQNFTFDLTLKDTDLLTEIFIPDLNSFVPGKIHGSFDSEKQLLNLDIAITKIKYATTVLDSFTVTINSDSRALLYSVKLHEFKYNAFKIAALRFQGEVANDIIETNFLILDSLDKEKYLLSGVIKSNPEGFRYSLNSDPLLLNYEQWLTPPDNYLQVKNGVLAHNFSISKGDEKFSIVTTPSDSTISFDFSHWQLSTIAQLVEGIAPLSGEMNGNVKITTSLKGEFSSSLQVSNLFIQEKELGDLSLSLSYKAKRYAVDLKAKGNRSAILAKGFYEPTATSAFDLDVSLSPFDVSLIEPFSGNQLKDVSGFVNGTLKVSGNIQTPVIRGKLTFDEVHFLATYLNNSFTLKNESIVFKEEGISLNSFKVVDEKNNAAAIDGVILTKFYKDFDFDLKLNAQNFQLLNTEATNNALYYGRLAVNVNARIGGGINQPVITGALKIVDGSEITYVVPTEEKSALEQKGIVQFVNNKADNDPFLKNVSMPDTAQVLFRGMDVDVTIDLTDKSTLNIVIDPITGDKLSLKGSSTLVYNAESSGSTNLSGRYEITSGTYNFTFYKLTKREFDIVKGSSITWAGDPLNASMDIRALYRVETSPLDLVYNQINSANQSELNSYNVRLPFLVYMNIGGKLLVPDIKFQLDMPDDKRNVFGGAIYSKLQDINTRESDLNKQVFALLILKRFISDNPFETQAGSGLNNTARVSVSRLLSEQLNRLSENVKGVQLSFDVKSFETNTGTEVKGQTKLQLGVSKNLFNDRLVVKLAGNVDIEGENTNQKDITEYIGDLALEFKLTPDGRLRLTGFRNSNYDMIDGELTETGAGLIYIKDYNVFKELFKSNAKTK